MIATNKNFLLLFKKRVKMQKQLKRKGYIRESHESPNDFLIRVSASDSNLGLSLAKFTENYVCLAYQKGWLPKERELLLKRMRTGLKKLG